jgi:multiple sugar transport system substrate-binding protein
MVFVSLSFGQSLAQAAEVNMWVYDELASSEEKALVQAAREFEAQNPDITIVFQNVPHRGLMDKFIAASVTGKVPDVVHVALAWSIELGAMGHAEALDEYIGAKRDEIPQGALESSTYRGALYGLPWYVDATALFYNKDMFHEAGLPLPGEEPMSWDQLRDVAQKLTRDVDGDGTIDQYGFGMRKGRGASICWFPFLFANEGKLYSEDGLNPAFNSPEGLESFKFLTDLYADELMPPGAIAYDTWDDARNAFVSGKMAMYIAGNWEIGPMTDAAKFDWGVAPHPKQKVRSSFLGGSSFIIPSKSQNKNEAWLWLDFLTDAGSMKYMADDSRIPARVDATEAEHIKANPLFGVFAAQAVYAKSHASIYAGVIRTEVGVAFDEVMLGQKDAETALNDAAQRVQEKMRPDLPGK